MSRLEGLFADYASSHTQRLTKATHFVGIPLIGLCLFGLGSRVTLFVKLGVSFDLGLLLVIVLSTIYLRWHLRLGAGTAVLLLLLWLAGGRVGLPLLWVGLALGTGLQYLGHYAFEGRQPAFHRNLIHTLIGPLWIAAEFFSALGLSRR